MLLIQARLINLVSVIANKLVPSEDCALLAVFYRTSTCLLFPWDCTVVHCYSNDNQYQNSVKDHSSYRLTVWSFRTKLVPSGDCICGCNLQDQHYFFSFTVVVLLCTPIPMAFKMELPEDIMVSFGPNWYPV